MLKRKKNLVKNFWHGSVGHNLAHGDKQKELEAQIAEKEKDIRTKVEVMRLKDSLLVAKNKQISSLEEKVKCEVCLKVPTSAPLYNCPEGHIICSPCYSPVRYASFQKNEYFF